MLRKIVGMMTQNFQKIKDKKNKEKKDLNFNNNILK
jgi:hypothetical protein